MRKLLFALLVSAFVFSYALSASATELKTYGYFRAFVSHVTNYNFDDKTDGDEFTAAQRLRPYFDFIANENLKATLALEFDTTWGAPKTYTPRDTAGAAGMDTSDNTELKRAMLTFKYPGTNVVFKIGAQGMSLPGTFGGVSPVLSGDITGAIVSAPINDMVSITLGWARPWDGSPFLGGHGGEVDAFFLAAPVKLDGMEVTPYALYANVGKYAVPTLINAAHKPEIYLLSGAANAYASGALPGTLTPGHSNLWYLGLAYKISMFEPIVVKGNIIYGSLDSNIKYTEAGKTYDDIANRKGWYVDLAVDYKMDNMTPSVYGYYFSGDDDDPTDGSETIPVLASDGWGTPGGIAVGSTSVFCFSDNNYSLVGDSPTGVWVIGFALKDISLIDNLKSTLGIEYGQGTIDSKLIKNEGVAFAPQIYMDQVLTDEDSFVQVLLTSKYKIYENLAAVLELGYASLDMDEDTWGKDYLSDDAYVVTFGFSYDF